MRAKWFVLGIIATVIALSAAAYVYFEQGFVSVQANAKPSIVDEWLGQASESSIKRHAPTLTNPEAGTPESLIAAARLYGSHCAICHGSPAQPESKLGFAENPPAPQFFAGEPPDMTESQNFYITKNGIRMTAMPAWANLLSDQQIWQIVDLLKSVNDKTIPANVTQELNAASGTL